MAELNGVNNSKRTVSVPSVKLKASNNHGRLRVAYDEITLSGELAANDIIKMMNIPAGAKIYDCILEHGGIDSTVDVGWAASAEGGEAADVDGLLDGISMASAGKSSMSGIDALGGYAKEFSEEVEVQIKILDISTTADTEVIKLQIIYAVD